MEKCCLIDRICTNWYSSISYFLLAKPRTTVRVTRPCNSLPVNNNSANLIKIAMTFIARSQVRLQRYHQQNTTALAVFKKCMEQMHSRSLWQKTMVRFIRSVLFHSGGLFHKQRMRCECNVFVQSDSFFYNHKGLDGNAVCSSNQMAPFTS